ncbi:minichromosome maintenance complex-binding protein [Tanacetum coccineum]
MIDATDCGTSMFIPDLLRGIRKSMLRHVTVVLGDDELAANFMLLHLSSKVMSPNGFCAMMCCLAAWYSTICIGSVCLVYPYVRFKVVLAFMRLLLASVYGNSRLSVLLLSTWSSLSSYPISIYMSAPLSYWYDLLNSKNADKKECAHGSAF